MARDAGRESLGTARSASGYHRDVMSLSSFCVSMPEAPQHSLFAAELERAVDRWAALLPAEVRAAFRHDLTRFGLHHDLALSTLQRILERSASAHAVDAATGLATRRPFHDRLASLVSASSNDTSLVVGVIFIDVDKLKQINDTRGHQIGDRALASIGGIMREAMRIDAGLDILAGAPSTPPTVGRQGGDEFVAALRLSATTTLDEVARRVKARADDPDLQRQHGYTGPPELKVSVGGVAYQSTAAGRETASNSIATALLAAADTLMYEGKRDGHIHLASARFERQLKLEDRRRLAPSASEPAE